MDTTLSAAWDLAIARSASLSASLLKLARDGHRNATSIVRNELAACDCESCGPLEDCPGATPEAFARRDALRALWVALGHPPSW